MSQKEQHIEELSLVARKALEAQPFSALYLRWENRNVEPLDVPWKRSFPCNVSTGYWSRRWTHLSSASPGFARTYI